MNSPTPALVGASAHTCAGAAQPSHHSRFQDRRHAGQRARAEAHRTNVNGGEIMTRALLAGALLATALVLQSTAGVAQTEISVPGGATGANVFCLQVGDLTSGTFVGTFLQT